MNIIMASGEAFPFCKTGGMADVTGALSQVLSRIEGNQVALFLPRYRNAGGGAFSLRAVPGRFVIPIGERLETASLSHVQWGKVAVYFIENAKYYDRAELYRTKSGDYSDNDERFIFYAKAVLEGAKFIGFKPDVIHCHDWQAALIPAYLKTLYSIDGFYAKTSSVFTIHNIAYQGVFPKETLMKAGFGWMDFTPEKLEYYGGINFLKAGLVFADKITTVSPSYASEIRSGPEFGRGLEGVLKARTANIAGVVNGIDTDLWNPETDSFLAKGYDSKTFSRGKAACKRALQHECGLEEKNTLLTAGVVSRLDPQKGLDMVLAAAPELINRVQLIILGVGEPALQAGFTQLAADNPKRVFFKAGFDEVLAHRIYAGSDIFLMPSRFEPCGLGQMIAMRYGAVPVVTSTGGLADTVFGNEESGISNGFVMKNADTQSLAQTVHHAVSVFGKKEIWNQIARNGINGDYSWDKAAQVYLDIYAQSQSLNKSYEH